MTVNTLDELIARLTDLRSQLPGDTPVLMTTHGRNEYLHVEVHVSRVGKGRPNIPVSRGGIPVVLLSE